MVKGIVDVPASAEELRLYFLDYDNMEVSDVMFIKKDVRVCSCTYVVAEVLRLDILVIYHNCIVSMSSDPHLDCSPQRLRRIRTVCMCISQRSSVYPHCCSPPLFCVPHMCE